MRIRREHHRYIGWWVFSGVLLAAINIGIWSGDSPEPPGGVLLGSPASWAGSILLAIAVCALDLVWIGLLIVWLMKRRMRIPEEESLVHPSNEHPAEDPKTQEKLTK